MLLTVENQLKTLRPRHHEKASEQGTGGRLLHLEAVEGAEVTKCQTWSSWMVGSIERDGGLRPDVCRLVSLAGASRAQLAVLTKAAVTAGLREQVTGVTFLASVRTLSPRLTEASIARATGPRPGVIHSLSKERGGVTRVLRLEARVDEGGIYSW